MSFCSSIHRASKSPLCLFRPSRWNSTRPIPDHHIVTHTLSKTGDAETRTGLSQERITLRGSGGELEIDKRERHREQNDFDDAVEGPDPAQINSTINQSTVRSTYQWGGSPPEASLPKLPEPWNFSVAHGGKRTPFYPNVFREAASMEPKRSSQLTSQVMPSEAAFEAHTKKADDLLYPHDRLPQGWYKRLGVLLQSRLPSSGSSQDIPGLGLSPLADIWFAMLQDAGTMLEATQRWQGLRIKQRRIRWPHIMLRCLVVSPSQALWFLSATHVRPFPSFEIVMDALFYIKRAYRDELGSNEELRSQYRQILSLQRQPSRWAGRIERKHLALLIEDSSYEEGKALFEDMANTNIDLNLHCLLRFMDFFTQHGDIDSALAALNSINLASRRRFHSRLLRSCTNLLKHDFIQDDLPSPNFYILPRLLEAGVRPNLVLHNMIIKKAVNLGASVVAWDLFRHLRRHGQHTDAQTHLILMQDALARRDIDGLEEVLALIEARETLSQNPYLLVHKLTAIRVMHGSKTRLSPTLLFAKMVAEFRRVFSTAPLRHLEMIGDEEVRKEETDAGSPPSQKEPDTATLAHVILEFVRIQRSAAVVQALFNRVEYLRSQGDDIGLALSRIPPFYDAFIRFFGRESVHLPRCLELVQLMLDRGVQPSGRTWGSLSSTLKRHGQSQAAEQLEKMMMEQKGLYIIPRQETNNGITVDEDDQDLEQPWEDMSDEKSESIGALEDPCLIEEVLPLIDESSSPDYSEVENPSEKQPVSTFDNCDKVSAGDAPSQCPDQGQRHHEIHAVSPGSDQVPGPGQGNKILSCDNERNFASSQCTPEAVLGGGGHVLDQSLETDLVPYLDAKARKYGPDDALLVKETPPPAPGRPSLSIAEHPLTTPSIAPNALQGVAESREVLFQPCSAAGTGATFPQDPKQDHLPCSQIHSRSDQAHSLSSLLSNPKDRSSPQSETEAEGEFTNAPVLSEDDGRTKVLRQPSLAQGGGDKVQTTNVPQKEEPRRMAKEKTQKVVGTTESDFVFVGLKFDGDEASFVWQRLKVIFDTKLNLTRAGLTSDEDEASLVWARQEKKMKSLEQARRERKERNLEQARWAVGMRYWNKFKGVEPIWRTLGQQRQSRAAHVFDWKDEEGEQSDDPSKGTTRLDHRAETSDKLHLAEALRIKGYYQRFHAMAEEQRRK